MKKKISKAELAKRIEYALLRPNATRADIIRICRESMVHQFWAVCILSYWIPLAARELGGSGVKICAPVGFPLGANATSAKVQEAEWAILQGAEEVDFVINIGALKAREEEEVFRDIEEVVMMAHYAGLRKRREKALVKAIIETCYLTRDEKIRACSIAKEAGADFIKTSTGFGPSGATVDDVKLIRKVIGPDMGIKAAGGIRTLKDALKMIKAGANRIGTSHAVEIIEAFNV